MSVAGSYDYRSSSGARADSLEFPHLPCGPLADALVRVIERDMPFAPLDQACRVYGISSKALREWQGGRRQTVKFDTADTVLCRTGLLWWEVWGFENETARRAFTGEVRDAA